MVLSRACQSSQRRLRERRSITTPVCQEAFFFFFNDTATTEIYTLSLHDALPISRRADGDADRGQHLAIGEGDRIRRDRKSTRLNSSHTVISYAVFCLKKKKSGSPQRKTSTHLERCARRLHDRSVGRASL